MLHTNLRRTTVIVAISTSLIAAACGGDGGGETAAALDIDEVAACLAGEGFEVTRETEMDPANVLPDAYKESVGLLETMQLGSIGDRSGLGGVGVYESTGEAEESHEAAVGFFTDDVLSGVSGTATWDYIVTSGDDGGVEAAITSCLG